MAECASEVNDSHHAELALTHHTLQKGPIPLSTCVWLEVV